MTELKQKAGQLQDNCTQLTENLKKAEISLEKTQKEVSKLKKQNDTHSTQPSDAPKSKAHQKGRKSLDKKLHPLPKKNGRHTKAVETEALKTQEGDKSQAEVSETGETKPASSLSQMQETKQPEADAAKVNDSIFSVQCNRSW